METCTAPSELGMISTEYDDPLPAKFDAVPFVTLRSVETNPDTGSLKVIVIGIGETFVAEVVVEVRTTVGAVRSEVRVRVADAALPLAALSCALPAPTDTSTDPSAVGAISAVYTVPLTATKLEATPFVTTRSPTANPVTPSLKVTVIGIGLRFETEGAVEVIRAVG